MKQVFLITLLISFSTSGFSQAIVRQSINTLSGSNLVQKSVIEQTIGQPYQPEQSNLEGLHIRSGFIQSPSMNVSGEQIEKDVKVNLYPNPTSNKFTVEAEENLGNVTIQISEITGNIMEILSLSDFQDKQFDCSTWSNGAYFISIITEDGKRSNSKLIISK